MSSTVISITFAIATVAIPNFFISTNLRKGFIKLVGHHNKINVLKPNFIKKKLKYIHTHKNNTIII